MQIHSIAPKEIAAGLWRYRHLIVSLIRREVVGRYRGSVFGILWSLFNPIFMLIVYTFVFSVIFKARWSSGGESRAEFALVLFIGLLLFNLFSECINRAPALILSNANFVKKVLFPLEILPWVVIGTAFFHTLVSFLVWLIFSFFILGTPHITTLLFPVILLPLTLYTLGFTWLLASLGVYLRDIGHLTRIVTTTLMFLTPIFYPLSAIPSKYHPLIYTNPLAFIVEQARCVLIYGTGLDWGPMGLSIFFSLCTLWLGFAWFQKTRKGFPDVM